MVDHPRVETLRARHRELDARIQEEERRPSPDDMKVANSKTKWYNPKALFLERKWPGAFAAGLVVCKCGEGFADLCAPIAYTATVDVDKSRARIFPHAAGATCTGSAV
jgi:hypothetical protein